MALLISIGLCGKSTSQMSSKVENFVSSYYKLLHYFMETHNVTSEKIDKLMPLLWIIVETIVGESFDAFLQNIDFENLSKLTDDLAKFFKRNTQTWTICTYLLFFFKELETGKTTLKHFLLYYFSCNCPNHARHLSYYYI